MVKLVKHRIKPLYFALLVAILLLMFDRSAAYLYRPGQDATKVVIYSTETCPYCKMLRAFLDKHRVAYTVHDVNKSIAGIMGFWTLRARGIPVSTVGPDIIHGYDINKIQASLIKLGYKINPVQHN